MYIHMFHKTHISVHFLFEMQLLKTPLHVAASAGRVDVVKLLIGKLGHLINTPQFSEDKASQTHQLEWLTCWIHKSFSVWFSAAYQELHECTSDVKEGCWLFRGFSHNAFVDNVRLPVIFEWSNIALWHIIHWNVSKSKLLTYKCLFGRPNWKESGLTKEQNNVEWCSGIASCTQHTKQCIAGMARLAWKPGARQHNLGLSAWLDLKTSEIIEFSGIFLCRNQKRQVSSHICWRLINAHKPTSRCDWRIKLKNAYNNFVQPRVEDMHSCCNQSVWLVACLVELRHAL